MNRRKARFGLLVPLAFLAAGLAGVSAQERGGARSIKEHYTKQEHLIPMRDGVRLFTSVYLPKDASRKYPILMMRTPYSVGPYGRDQYRGSLGPNRLFANTHDHGD